MDTKKAGKFEMKEIGEPPKYYYYEFFIRQNMIWVKIFLSVLAITCSSYISIKPLHRSDISNSCELSEDQSKNISEIDKVVRRYNPEISKAIYLTPNYGGPIKTLKTYKYMNGNAFERMLLFHFVDKYNYELKLDTLIIEGGKKEIRKKIFDDASVCISDVQDLIFYIKLSEDEYDEIKNITNIVFRIQDMILVLDSKCKGTVLY